MKQRLKHYRSPIEAVLQDCLQNPKTPESLHQAMDYSLRAGGKRIRPIFCLVWAELMGARQEQVLGFCASLELIHTYSLIHDDLPAMDNDDLRRGKPSNHVRFGEDLAILAGDGLLTQAFSMMLSTDLSPRAVLRAAHEISQAVGPGGMVGGQVLDMALTGSSSRDLDALRQMHALKTGAFIQSACVAGALLSTAPEADLERASTYGGCVGLAFQVADDILDITGDQDALGKPIGSDAAQNKLTYPALLGLDESRRLGQDMVVRAQEALTAYSGSQAVFLRDLAQYIMDRIE